MLLQKKLQESVTVIDPQKASDNLDGCAQDMFDAKVLWQGHVLVAAWPVRGVRLLSI